MNLFAFYLKKKKKTQTHNDFLQNQYKSKQNYYELTHKSISCTLATSFSKCSNPSAYAFWTEECWSSLTQWITYTFWGGKKKTIQIKLYNSF